MRRSKTWLALGPYVFLLLLSTAAYAGLIDERLMIPMADGVCLDTRIIRLDETSPVPVALCRTPYNQLDDTSNFWLAMSGFAVVMQNTRGRYASEGTMDVFASDGWGLHQDGVDTVNWLLAQPWCNGQICTFGFSAPGINENRLAGAAPSGLVAQYIDKGSGDFHTNVLYSGGVFRYGLVVPWLLGWGYGTQYITDILNHPPDDAYWADFAITERQNLRDYPITVVTGWYDCFLQGSLDNFASLRQHGGTIAREQSKLVITLTTHNNNNTGCLPFPSDATLPPTGYGELEMFLHHVRGAANGFDQLPRVAYYMIGDLETPGAPGNEWRYADDWPVPSTSVPFYFHGDHTLRLSAPTAANQSFTYTFNPASPVPTLGGANLTSDQGNHDQQSIESRPDVLLFQTEPLSAPIELTGRITANVYASSDRIDTDFTAKLTDVYPDGKSVILCDGIIRTRYRDGLEQQTFMTPGTLYLLQIDLTSTAVTFNTGHRIRVAISSSNDPRFAANPNNGQMLVIGSNYLIAHNTIRLEASHPSNIVLPVTGPDTDNDGTPNLVDPFPENPNEWNDADADGLGDNFENLIINFSPTDAYRTLADVLPSADFDADGRTNADEFAQGTNPTFKGIRLLSPNGGEDLKQCQTFPITWESEAEDCTEVKLKLFKGGTFNRWISGPTPNDGNFQWQVPSDLVVGCDYTVQVYCAADFSIIDVSDGPFHVVQSPIQITSPNGGEELKRGQTFPITWESEAEPCSEVKLKLLKGGTFNRWISGPTPNDGQFQWQVPPDLPLGVDYRVQIYCADDFSVIDFSEGPFSIVAPPIQLTHPNGGEQFAPCDPVIVTWSSETPSCSEVKLKLFQGGAFNRWISGPTPNDGQFLWKVPCDLPPGTDYTIQIYCASDFSVIDFSDGAFAVNTTRIRLIAPNGAELVSPGGKYSVQWDSDGDVGSEIKLKLFKAGVFNRWVSGPTANDGEFQWKVPVDLPEGSDYKIQIYSATNFSIIDSSDTTFAISSGKSPLSSVGLSPP